MTNTPDDVNRNATGAGSAAPGDRPEGGDAPVAVVLLSGGMDSATVLALAQAQGFRCHALSFEYGQRHHIETQAARRVARRAGLTAHHWVRIDPQAVTGSALTSPIDVPKDRDPRAIAGSRTPPSPEAGIPVTYVPARNTIFLAYAVAFCETLHSGDIFIGVTAVDYSGYPDCRPEYIEAFERMANLATKAAAAGRRLRIHAPLIHWPKTRIIQRGLELGVDYGLTHSCYDPSPEGAPCRRCDACILRTSAFAELGLTDPALDVNR